MKYEGPIKCTIELAEKMVAGQPNKIKSTLEYVNGDAVSANEIIPVDIGPQSEWGHYIPLNLSPLKWKIKNYTPDIPDRYWQRRCFAVMFRSVGLLIPMKYESVKSNNETAFFNQEFTSDLSVFDDRPGVLAQAYLYHENNPPEINGLMQWNDNHYLTPFGDSLPAWMVDPVNYTEGEKFANGNIKTLDTQPMLEIGMHELDHNHGLVHDLNSPESLMYPYVKKGCDTTVYGDVIENVIIEKHFQRTDDDIQRYENTYGRRKLAWWLLYNMRSRRVRARRVPEVPYWVAV